MGTGRNGNARRNGGARPPLLVRMEEAARLCGISLMTVRRLIMEDEGSMRKAGAMIRLRKRVLFDPDRLVEWMAKGTSPALRAPSERTRERRAG